MQEITEREYWRARRKWAFEHTELWSKGKFITGPIVGVIACALQWWFGLRVMGATLQFAATLVGAYFIVAFGQLMLNWIYYAPVAHDRECATEITNLKNDNRSLTEKSEKLVTFQFTQAIFRHGPNPAVIVHAKVLNHGSALTLHEIRLTTKSDKTILVKPKMNTFPRHAIDEIKLDPGVVETAYFVFEEGDIERDWAIEYLDNWGKPHREPIPRELYERTPPRPPRKEFADVD